jgi:hypothetical protein
MKDVKALSKKAIKLERAFARTNDKHTTKKARLLKQALSVEKKLLVAMRKLMPLTPVDKVKDMIRHQLAWMQERMQARRGRKIQKV